MRQENVDAFCLALDVSGPYELVLIKRFSNLVIT